jgi:hypothetical protein
MRGAFVLSLVCAVAFGAPAPSSSPSVPRTIYISARLQAESNHPLSPKDFTVQVNGKRAPVLTAKTPHDSQMILVVLDLAGDLTNAQSARDSVISEIGKLPPSTYVALIRAQDGPTVLVDPTPDRAAIADAIQASPVTGKAGLLDSVVSIEALADSIAQASNVRVAILFVTDSNIRNYREDFANPVINSSDSHDLSRRFPEALIGDKIGKLEAEMAAHDTPLYIAHLQYSASTLSAAYQAGLKRLAEATGGWSTFCASTAEIPDAIHEGFGAIVSEYTLTVALPGKPHGAVQIRVEAPQQELIYRPRLIIRSTRN